MNCKDNTILSPSQALSEFLSEINTSFLKTNKEKKQAMVELECVDLILITKQQSSGCPPPQNSNKIIWASFHLKLMRLTETSLWSTARHSHHEKLPSRAPQRWALPHRHFLVSTWTSDGYWGLPALTSAIYHFKFSFYSCFTDFWSLHLNLTLPPCSVGGTQREVMSGDQRWGKSRQPPQLRNFPYLLCWFWCSCWSHRPRCYQVAARPVAGWHI